MIHAAVLDELKRIVGSDGVLFRPEDMLVYECDGQTVFKHAPDAVVFPRSVEQVSKIVKLCAREKVPFVARGSGTGLSGGPVAARGGVTICLSRMNKIIDADVRNQVVVVEAGVINTWVTDAVSGEGHYFAPDPSSQPVSTIGGNIGHNSGGAHCLKYGVISNHVLGLEVVLPSGEIIQTGGKAQDLPGYDLTGLIVGSEGTLGIVTKAILRVIKRPQAAKTIMAIFESVADASNTVSEIIANGIIPGAVEFMDNLAIEAVESSVHAAGFPRDAQALLLIEPDGLSESLDSLADRIVKICRGNRAREIRLAQSKQERLKWWTGRKQAFGAMGRLSPNFLVLDGTIPRSQLPRILALIGEISRRYSIRIANVFHAGDGNLHPLVLYDARKAGETEKAMQAAMEVLRAVAEIGGTITGEHGVGLEKRDAMHYIFTPSDISVMKSLKATFDRNGLCNPDKIFPSEKATKQLSPMPAEA
jgi:glycolate oxidase